MGKEYYLFSRSSVFATSKLEREVNFFAADFLISDEKVLDLVGSSDANFLV